MEPDPGVCQTCRHAQPVTTSRGARFVRCKRADTDAAYAKYPVLPMIACPGYQQVGAEGLPRKARTTLEAE